MEELYLKLVIGLRNGDAKLCQNLAKELLDGGASGEDIALNAIHPAMDMMSDKCTSEQFNLLELMLAGRAVLATIKTIYPEDGEEKARANRETVVLAALEGDVHDLGKGIVKIVLSTKGFSVVDCGKDVSVETTIQAALSQNASAVCISGLISSVIPQVSKIKARLNEEGRADILVLAGGAALSQCAKEELGVDFVGSSAFDALRFLEEKLGYAK